MKKEIYSLEIVSFNLILFVVLHHYNQTIKSVPHSNHPKNMEKFLEATERYVFDSYKGKYFFREKSEF